MLERTRPEIIGFGEFHQQSGTGNVLSSLTRFTEALLPLMAAELSDLVVETWVSTGSCGKAEKAVTREVNEVTDRPEATEDETIALIKRAAGLGIRPHVLKLTCKDYETLRGDAGVDYLKLLELVGRRWSE